MAAYVQSPLFPCLGARSAFNKDRVRYGLYGGFGNGHAVDALCADLECFSQEFPDPGSDPVTFIAMFDDDVATETQFARRLWQHLQAMHDHDRNDFEWDPTVSSDPSRSDFSFSVAGRAFFVVGLCPVSSRLSRRAPMPCLVFNFHDQFETLRASGKFALMKDAIRKRDIALQGSINPVLAHFGQASEARQYSGQDVPQGWRCPFQYAELAEAA